MKQYVKIYHAGTSLYGEVLSIKSDFIFVCNNRTRRSITITAKLIDYKPEKIHHYRYRNQDTLILVN